MGAQLFFDVETTGLPLGRNAHPSNLDVFDKCRVVSIAWCLRDADTMYSQHYHVVDPGLPPGQEIGASFIHGITRDIVDAYGIRKDIVLDMFLQDLKRSTILIAHNMTFDINVVASELYRLDRKEDADALLNSDTMCTMKSTTDIVKLPSRYGRSYKWPKLAELYKFLFGYEFDNQHNALADVDALVRCFYELYGTSKKRSREEPEEEQKIIN